MSNLADRLNKVLDASGGKLTQAGLAAACGISAVSVHGWAKGKSRSMMAEHVFPAAAYLGVRAAWLATGLGPMRPSSHVGEEPLVYGDWPIKAISLAEYLRLPREVRADIEKYIHLQLQVAHAHGSGLSTRAA